MHEIKVVESVTKNAQRAAQALVKFEVKVAQAVLNLAPAFAPGFYLALEISKQACHYLIISATSFSARPRLPWIIRADQASHCQL